MTEMMRQAETPARHVERKRVSILGASGSVGSSTLDLISRDPAAYDVVALTANANVEALAAYAIKSGARIAVIADENRYEELKQALSRNEFSLHYQPQWDLHRNA